MVNEKGELNDELGFASGFASPVGNSITVTDTSHYITQPFVAGGPADIFRRHGGFILSRVHRRMACNRLPTWGAAGGLVVLEIGADLYGGGTADGRRVMLPLGRDATFNWDYLNNNGRLIVQRAIEWGIEQGPFKVLGPSLWFATQAKVVTSGAPGLDAWNNSEILSFADPGLAFEPGTTGGTLSAVLDLNAFGSDVVIDAMHYVGSDITVGSANSVDLQTGDILLSTAADETLTSLNSISVKDEDVFVFRPFAAGGLSMRHFYLSDRRFGDS